MESTRFSGIIQIEQSPAELLDSADFGDRWVTVSPPGNLVAADLEQLESELQSEYQLAQAAVAVRSVRLAQDPRS